MNYDKAMNMDKVEFGNMPPQAFLLGLLSAFDNRFQASAGAFFQDITWKQFFAIICIRLCREAPTLNDLSEVMGSSHQNVKQILLKLEKKGLIEVRNTVSGTTPRAGKLSAGFLTGWEKKIWRLR